MTSATEAKAAVEEVFASLAPTEASLDWHDATTLIVYIEGTEERFSIDLDDSATWIRAKVADRFQTILIEWSHTLIPPCPRHPSTHPLESRVVDGTAVWLCPTDGVVITAI